MKRVLFFREYTVYTGGHLKLWDYFEHVLNTPGYEARISFTANSKWDETNPWRNSRDLVLGPEDPWEAYPPDLLFMEGTDWPRLPDAWRKQPPVPVLNLIQHVRHADPANERSAFLPHPAIRICASTEIEEALRQTGQVNGPVLTNPYGIDLSHLPPPPPANERPVDILIGALKRPDIGQQLYRKLQKLGGKSFGFINREFPPLNVQLLEKPMLRDEYLKTLGQAKIAVFLPTPTEGFFLPALEAMALGTLVICPDVVGNRSFCLDGVNSCRPPYTVDALLESARRMLRLTPVEQAQWRQKAFEMTKNHELARERRQFQGILERVDELWSEVTLP